MRLLENIKIEIRNYIARTLERECPNLKFSIKYSKKMRRTLGQCVSRKNKVSGNLISTIILSESYLESCLENSRINNIWDTVIHEVAHAVAFYRFGHGVGHDYRWKQIATQLGCKPERLAWDAPKFYKPYRYIYKCPICGKETKVLRKYKKGVACGKCCHEFNGGKYSSDYILDLVVDEGRVIQAC